MTPPFKTCVLGHVTCFSGVLTPWWVSVGRCVSVPSHRSPEEGRGAGAMLARAVGNSPSLWNPHTMEGKEVSGTALLPEQIKAAGSPAAAAAQPRGRKPCPRFAFYFHRQSECGARSPACTPGRGARCSLCVGFLLSCCFTGWQLRLCQRSRQALLQVRASSSCI